VRLLRSFSFAFEGVGYLLRTQRNFRIELVAGVLAIGAGVWARLEHWEWAVLVLTIALVLILEAINTAIEDAVTLTSPGFAAKAKAAKDASAAAVLVAALASVFVGALLFGARLIAPR
jgi:undecaprenol kinase